MSMKSAPSVLALAFLALGPAPKPAAAATASASFSVSATVLAGCQVASAMAYRSYKDAVANATSTVSVACTQLTPYNVGLSAGLAPGATVAIRRMTGPGSALLGYALASNSQEIVNRGQTVGADSVAGTGNGSAQARSVQGQIPAGQYVAASADTDTITVTVTY